MATEPPPSTDPLEALRFIEVLVNVAVAADNPAAADLILREIQKVLILALPKKPRRGRRKP